MTKAGCAACHRASAAITGEEGAHDEYLHYMLDRNMVT
jgi:hypothetical protein